MLFNCDTPHASILNHPSLHKTGCGASLWPNINSQPASPKNLSLATERAFNDRWHVGWNSRACVRCHCLAAASR